MKIHVIRHGLTELNKKWIINGHIDEPLSEEGVDQAKSAIEILPQGIKQIYASTLTRAKQTAHIINSRFKAPIYLHDELREIHFGSLSGKAWDALENANALKAIHRAMKYDYRPYGGESAEQVRKRVIAFLKKIHRRHKDHEALIVTHGGIIRMIHLLENEVPLKDIGNVSLHGFDLNKMLLDRETTP